VKGDPVPHGIIHPPTVKDLDVRTVEAGNKLMWTMPDYGSEVSKIVIYRSGLSINEDSCPGCPKEYELIAEPEPKDLVWMRDSKRVEYIDSKIKTGTIYTYFIKVCDSSGLCGQESNKAEIKVKKVSGAGAVQPVPVVPKP